MGRLNPISLLICIETRPCGRPAFRFHPQRMSDWQEGAKQAIAALIVSQDSRLFFTPDEGLQKIVSTFQAIG